MIKPVGNDAEHPSKCAETLTKKEDSGVLMEWPSQSPDLNPIEQIWHLVGLKIDRTKVSSKAISRTLTNNI